MYGYIYKTTNLVSGKIYIGQKHSGKFLGQSYLGSGRCVKEAIKHYGKKNFKVELLEEVETKELMDEREIYWISYYHATNKEIGYNLSEGGLVNRTLVGENNPFYGKHHTKESRRKNSESCKGRVAWNKGLTKDDPRVAKYSNSIKKSLQENGSHAKDTIWIHLDSKDKMIKPNELEMYLSSGWLLGRSELSKESCERHSKAILGRIRINNGDIEKNVKSDEIQLYLESGWIRGRLKFKSFNRKNKLER